MKTIWLPLGKGTPVSYCLRSGLNGWIICLQAAHIESYDIGWYRLPTDDNYMAPFGKGDTCCVVCEADWGNAEFDRKQANESLMFDFPILCRRFFADDPLQIILHIRFLADDPAETLRKAYRNYVVKQPWTSGKAKPFYICEAFSPLGDCEEFSRYTLHRV